MTEALIGLATHARESAPLAAPAGAVLFRPSDPCGGFLVVQKGVVRVSLTSGSGREIVLYRVRPGEICLQTFSCLVQDRPYAAEGIAETPIEGRLIPRAAWDRLLDTDPAFRAAVMTSIASRFADYEQVVETLAFAGLEQRLAAALTRLTTAEGVVHATHEALAAEIGSAREAVSRQLAVFAREGLVRLSRGHIDVLRREELTCRAQPVV